MQRIIYSLIILVLTSQSCLHKVQGDECALQFYQVYKNKSLSLFENKSLYKRGKLIIYEMQTEIGEGKKQITFTYDSTLKKLSYKNKNDVLYSTHKSNLVMEEVKKILKIMEEYKIVGFHSEFKKNGVDLKFYFSCVNQLLFIKNREAISNKG